MAIQDFTRDSQVLLNFIRSVSDTHGGDVPECYEYVLRQVRTKLTWRDGMWCPRSVEQLKNSNTLT